jgi:hypothetical protein
MKQQAAQVGQGVECPGLAAAVGADEPSDLTQLDDTADTVQRHKTAEAFSHLAGDCYNTTLRL